jgi:apolipoprotein N-acyltransferase
MVHFDFAALRQTRWQEYAIRFLVGGLITAATGVIAKQFGPGIGGLFLAFPAIFPAGATLIEKHVKQKKQRAGLDGSKRARGAASLDAAGAAKGSTGLAAFALLVWWLMPEHKPYLVLAASALAWLVLSVAAWRLCRWRLRLLPR